MWRNCPLRRIEDPALAEWVWGGEAWCALSLSLSLYSLAPLLTTPVQCVERGDRLQQFGGGAVELPRHGRRRGRPPRGRTSPARPPLPPPVSRHRRRCAPPLQRPHRATSSDASRRAGGWPGGVLPAAAPALVALRAGGPRRSASRREAHAGMRVSRGGGGRRRGAAVRAGRAAALHRRNRLLPLPSPAPRPAQASCPPAAVHKICHSRTTREDIASNVRP
jgi:hypothetical protein